MGNGTEIIGGRPRARYQAHTASTAAASGRPGSPAGSALLARPVKPAAAPSRQPPSHSCSGACQLPAAATSSSSMDTSVIEPVTESKSAPPTLPSWPAGGVVGWSG